jgi:hypothetical protein
MHELQSKFAEAKQAHERSVLRRQINALDRRIDRLVYDLYGLGDDEIRTVEEATKSPAPLQGLIKRHPKPRDCAPGYIPPAPLGLPEQSTRCIPAGPLGLPK